MKCPIEVNISERDIRKLARISKDNYEGWFYDHKEDVFLMKMCKIGLLNPDTKSSIHWMRYQLTTIGTKLIKEYSNP